MNSVYRDARRTRRKYPVNWAWMNPDDMAEAGIAEEDEIESEVGRIRGMARAEERLRRLCCVSGVRNSTERWVAPQLQRGPWEAARSPAAMVPDAAGSFGFGGCS